MIAAESARVTRIASLAFAVSAACVGAVGPEVARNDATLDAQGLTPGTLDVTWMHGTPDCNQSTDPELQVHAYNATTYVIRQDKCRTFEAPFVYVLIGTQQVLVLDSGATSSTGLRDAIVPLAAGKPIVVAHSHAHGDHTAGDATWAGQATVVGKSLAAVQATFGIATWPTDPGSIDLGGRVLDVIAIPGHEATHIALYDRQTGLLLSGDSLYPGLLFIRDWATYRTSMHRLATFAAAHPIAHVLGAHVEMTRTPKVNYPYGTTYQPDEHALPLTAAHVAELDAALIQLGPTKPNGPIAHDDFVIDPR